MELEAADALSEEMMGAALDWRKAYDQVDLSTLPAVLARAGEHSFFPECDRPMRCTRADALDTTNYSTRQHRRCKILPGAGMPLVDVRPRQICGRLRTAAGTTQDTIQFGLIRKDATHDEIRSKKTITLSAAVVYSTRDTSHEGHSPKKRK